MAYSSHGKKRYDNLKELWPLLLEAVSLDNVLPLTSTCNLRCLFCSHRQNPPDIRTFNFPPLTMKVLGQLIPFLDASRKIVIGESSTRLCEGEPLTHPQFIDIMKELRRRFPSTPLQITTNGSLLTRNLLQQLMELSTKPVRDSGEYFAASLPSPPNLELVISLNSSSPVLRSKIMGDSDPRIVLEAIRFCRKYALPFHGSVVAVPYPDGWKDLKHTLFFLEEMGALTARVFLPGYTRFSAEGQPFKGSLWTELHNFLQELRDNLELPVVLEPPLKKDLLARVEGVIRNSPARQAGLKKGDIVTGVNGEKVISGVEAFYRIQKASDPLLEIVRPGGEDKNGGDFENLRQNLFFIKLLKKKGASSGIVLSYDLETETLDRITAEIERKRARNPFLFTSLAAAPLWEAAQRESLLPQNLCINTVENVFWGGSICCAGLLTVSDFAKHLEVLAAKREKPDLIIIPWKPFDRSGLDLRGEHYEKLPAAFPQFSFSFL